MCALLVALPVVRIVAVSAGLVGPLRIHVETIDPRGRFTSQRRTAAPYRPRVSWIAYQDELRQAMTREHALFVKSRRMVAKDTWRGVAWEVQRQFPDLVGADLDGNQIVGMFLCEIAGELLGRKVD
jgi:hypothetical protein